jgi:hypothetical protein
MPSKTAHPVIPIVNRMKLSIAIPLAAYHWSTPRKGQRASASDIFDGRSCQSISRDGSSEEMQLAPVALHGVEIQFHRLMFGTRG